MTRTLLHATVVALALVIVGAAFAGAAPVPRADDQGPMIVSGAVGQFYGYLTPAMVVEKGGELSYANFDIVQHDVVQDVEADEIANKKKDKWCRDFKKGECPLFWSPRAGLGDTVAVQGTKNLKPGATYTFFCTLHPGMKGTLVVAP
jgi:plastocyanin